MTLHSFLKPLAAAVVAASVAASGAFAHAVVSNPPSGVVSDRSGDSQPGHADIKSASVKVAPGFVVWTIVAYGNFSTVHAPCIDVVSVRPGGIEWAICGTAATGFGVSTFRPYPAGGGYAGKAGVSRPNASTIVYRVPRKTFRFGANLRPRPLGVAWQAQARDQPGCYPTICDRAPADTHLIFHP